MLPRPVTPEEQTKIDLIKKLLTYPKTRRRIGFGVKVVWGGLLGLSTLFALIALIPLDHILIPISLGVVGVGSGGMLIKAARDVFRKNKDEEEKTNALKAEIDQLVEALLDIDLEHLKQIQEDFSADSRKDKAAERQAWLNECEKTYARFWEQHAILERAILHFRAIKQMREAKNEPLGNYTDVNLVKLQNSLDELTLRKNNLLLAFKGPVPASDVDKKNYYLPKVEHVSTSFKKKIQQVEPPQKGFWSRAWEVTKKVGNRLSSFAVGASVGMSIGCAVLPFLALALGVSGAAALVTGPFAPFVFAGIFGGALLLGGISLLVDYIITRPQEAKINAVTESRNKAESHKDSAVKINSEFQHQHKAISDKRHHLQLVQQHADAVVVEQQRLEALRQAKEREIQAERERAAAVAAEHQRVSEEARRLAAEKDAIKQSSTAEIEKFMLGEKEARRALQQLEQAAASREAEMRAEIEAKEKARIAAEAERLAALQRAEEERQRAASVLASEQAQKEAELSQLRERAAQLEKELAATRGEKKGDTYV